MIREKFAEELEKQSEISYLEFQRKLIPGEISERIIGVRVPVVRKLYRNLIGRDEDIKKEFLREVIACNAGGLSLEEIMAAGYAAGAIDCEFEEWKKYVDGLVSHVDNWASCDSICVSLKKCTVYGKQVYDYLVAQCASENQFRARFGIVMLMSHFGTEEYIDEILELIEGFEKPEYYLAMGAGWALATFYPDFKDKVEKVLKGGNTDDTVRKIAIRKITESLCVSEEDKQRMRELRKKKGNIGDSTEI